MGVNIGSKDREKRYVTKDNKMSWKFWKSAPVETKTDSVSGTELKKDDFSKVLSAMHSGLNGTSGIDLNCVEVTPKIGWMLVRYDKMLRKGIEKPIEFQLKEGFYIEDDPDGTVLQVYDTLGLNKHVERALKLDRITGLGLVVFNLEDGNDYDTQLNINTLKGISSVKVYQKDEVSVSPIDTVTDRNDIRFGEPELYTVNPSNGGNEIKIHHSRCYLLDGIAISDQDQQQHYNIGGDSVFTGMMKYITNFWDSSGSAGKILSSYVQLIISIEGLQDMIANDRTEQLKKRMQMLKLGADTGNFIPLDSHEAFERKSSSVGGTKELIQSTEELLSAVFDIPYSIMFNEKSGGGINSGSKDRENWHDTIEWMQTTKAFGLIYFITQLIVDSSDYKTDSSDPKPVFNSLERLTKLQDAELKKNQSEVDTADIDNNVVTSGEVRSSRYGSGKYSPQTNIDEKNTPVLNRDKKEEL